MFLSKENIQVRYRRASSLVASFMATAELAMSLETTTSGISSTGRGMGTVFTSRRAKSKRNFRGCSNSDSGCTALREAGEEAIPILGSESKNAKDLQSE